MQFNLFLTLTLLFNLLLASFAQEPILLEHGSGVRTVEFSPVDAALIASAGEDNLIKLWNLKNNTARTLSGHTGIVSSLAFSPNGNLLASVSDDRTIKLWNVHNSQNIATLQEGTQFITVAFSPDGQLLATGGWMHVKLWDVRRQVVIATLQHDNFVRAVTFSHDGKLLAVGDVRESSGTVKVWDVKSREVVATLEDDLVVVRSVTFSSDDRYLASSHYNGEVKVWNASDWQLRRTLPAGDYDVAFSPDAKLIAGIGKGNVNLWWVENGTNVAQLPGPTGWMHPVDFSHDGASLAVGAEDGFIRLYNVEDIKEDIETRLQALQQPEMVRLIYFRPNDRPVRPDRVAAFRQLIKDTQQFFADEMERHGFGRKTFTVETDEADKALVHHVVGEFNDRYYYQKTVDKVWKELSEQFYPPKHVYLVAIDIGSEVLADGINEWCGEGSEVWTGGGQEIIIPASGHCFNIGLVAHELGHGFGLAHDFRDDAHVMSYGAIRNELSFCAAEWLAASRFLNTIQGGIQTNSDPTVEMLPPIETLPNAVRLRFEVTDPNGLHQAQLYIPTTAKDPVEGSGFKLHSCRALSGKVSTLEFITTELPNENAFARLRVMDGQGNFKWWEHYFPIQATDILRKSDNPVGAIQAAGNLPETLQKISGDKQRGSLNKRLAKPFVVSVRDANNEPVAGVQVTFRVTTGGGSLSVAKPWTDSNGHAETFLTLRRSLINDVEANVSGVSDSVTFNTYNVTETPLEKITGPWLWMIAPTEPGQGGANSINVDSLSEVSNGKVTEADVAAKGAKQGNSVGNRVWTLGEISPAGNNVTDLINEIQLGRGDVNDHSSYALITLESATAQSDVTMRAGSDDAIKIWLNGEVVHNNPIDREANDFQDTFKVELNKGDNLLLVKVSERRGWWSMFVGIDADINAVYKRPPPAPVLSSDVNGDGIVNILDLVSVATNFGKTGENPADVNGDGIVNIIDLVTVAGELGAGAAAPSAHPQILETLTAADVQLWLTQAQHAGLTDATSQPGILMLEQLLASLIPKETVLFPNYPNPFNPETWIPYQLATSDDVSITIYDARGSVVRRLELGHQPAGRYTNRSRAVYWDGRNAVGEPVASGIYFYMLTVGDFTATRKMLIRK